MPVNTLPFVNCCSPSEYAAVIPKVVRPRRRTDAIYTSALAAASREQTLAGTHPILLIDEQHRIKRQAKRQGVIMVKQRAPLSVVGISSL